MAESGWQITLVSEVIPDGLDAAQKELAEMYRAGSYATLQAHIDWVGPVDDDE